MNPVVYYHGGCPDGFGAAWAIWSTGNQDWEFVPASYYGNPPKRDEYKGRAVYMVDFSFSEEIVRDMLKHAESVTILDHHKTAYENLNHLLDEGLQGEIDLTRAGCIVTWKHFCGSRPVPELMLDIEDYDTWTWDRENTAYVLNSLSMIPQEFKVWDHMMNSARVYEKLIEDGKAIQQWKMREYKQVADNMMHPIEIGGHMVPAVNAPPFMINELADLLNEDAPFSVVYSQTPRGTKYSLRSRGRVDVSEIARQYGGGGHENAASFFVFNEE